MIHPNIKDKKNKNKGGFIPDIVAYKNQNVIFFENKDRFVLEDYEKVSYLKNTDNYNNSITKLLTGYNFQQIYYGIGLPATKINKQKDREKWTLVDFTIMVNQRMDIEVIYDPEELF